MRQELTPESIIAARKWFADNALACTVEARNRSDVLQDNEFYVNDLNRYKEDQQKLANEWLAGQYDHTFEWRKKVGAPLFDGDGNRGQKKKVTRNRKKVLRKPKKKVECY